MKKLLLLFAVLLSTVSGWAQSFTLQKSTDEGNPEYQYFIQNANSVFMDSQTSFVSAGKSNSSGKFAFFAYVADGATENDVLIYSIDANMWVSYTKAGSYDNKTDFVELEENKEDANPWRFSKNTNGSEAVYQFAPHNSTGIVSKYMNWFQGVNDATKNKTVGIYSDPANSDNGSAWILWPVNGKWRCYLKDVHNKYLNLSVLGQEPGNAGENRLATLTLEQAALYISVASDGRWQIHTDEDGGNYLKQSSSSRHWNSWVSEGEGAFCWTPEYSTLSGQRYLVLRNTSSSSPGLLGCTNHTAGEPLYVNNGNANALKLKMIDDNAEFAHITYKFVYKGQEKATEEYYMPVGSTFPSVQTVPDYIQCNPVPAGNIDIACNGKTYVINVYDEMPFQVSDSYENAVWYYMNIRSTGNNNNKPNKWVEMSATEPYSNVYGSKKTTDEAQWAFIGNPFDGIKVINKAAGANKTLSLNGDNIVMRDGQKVWNLQKGTGGFVLQVDKGTNVYAHDHNGSFRTWDSSSAKTNEGSAFNVIAVSSDAFEYATNVILGSKITDLTTIQDGQTVVFKSVPNSKYINISTALETGISSTLSGLSVFKIHVVDAETFTFESCKEGYYFPDIKNDGEQDVYMTATPNQYTILSKMSDNGALSEGEFVIKSLGTNGGYFDVQDGNDFCGWQGKGNNSKYEIYPVTVLGTTSAGVVNHCVLTDDDNNIYQYDYWAMPGTNPTISGIPSSYITNGSWNDKTYTADVSFPFPVSKTDGSADVSVLISGWRGTKDECYFKYYVDASSNVKVTSESPTSTNVRNFEWSIYPHLIGSDFRFIIKNLGTDKYVQTTAEGEATAQGTVTVGDEATATYFNWEENNRFKIVDKNLRLSVTSSETGDQDLGVDIGHGGCNTFVTNTTDYVNNWKTQNIAVLGYVGAYPATLQNEINAVESYSDIPTFEEEHVGDIIPLKEGYYYIKSVDLSKFAVNDNNGFRATTDPASEKSANNIFRLVSNGDGKYKFQSFANGKYVTLRNANTDPISSPSEIDEIFANGSSFSFEGNDFAQFKIKDENNKFMRHEGEANSYAINYWSSEVKYWYLIEAAELPVVIHSTGYSTFSAAVDVEVPDGVNAYYAKSYDADKVRMSPIQQIPANEGVVIQGTGSATVKFPIISNAAALPADNLLKAHLNTEAVTSATGSVFILGTRGVETGFYPLSTTNNIISGHKSYLEIPALQAARLSIVWDDTETGIHEAEGGEQNVEIYDLTGRRLDKPAKGVNIIGGKLVIK